jgi:hypothetical protein
MPQAKGLLKLMIGVMKKNRQGIVKKLLQFEYIIKEVLPLEDCRKKISSEASRKRRIPNPMLFAIGR